MAATKTRREGSRRKKAQAIKPNRYARWRAATLILVYVLMTAHVIHWRIAGRTLAPLELNEVVYTVELGIVTAGFLFMAVAVAATAIFGRFFCSWGCHILALQDLSAWMLERLKIKPKAVRSRLLLWIPAGAALYMFAWPLAALWWQGKSLPRLHLADDAAGWASFLTEHYWRNLPGPGVVIVTFVFVGFVVVYFLGTRAFCQYVCPYGAVFGLVDRVAPGRIRVTDDCKQCGACTAVCSSHVRVHEEVRRHGMVVDAACMKDLDCVAVCPNNALYYGFGRPSLVALTVNDAPVRKQYDFVLWEDALMGGVFVVVLFALRGLYDIMPFFLSMGIGALVAYAVVVLLRLAVRDAVKFNRWQLKAARRLLPLGRLFVGATALVLVAIAHGGLVRFHEWQGARLHDRVKHAPAAAGSETGLIAAQAIAHLEFADRWGLIRTIPTRSRLADLHAHEQRWTAAEPLVYWLVARQPGDARLRLAHGRALLGLGRSAAEAEGELRAALRLDPAEADAHYALSGLCFHAQRGEEALEHLIEAVRLRADFPEALCDLGTLLVGRGDLPMGIEHLQRAVALRSGFADAHYNLAVAYAMSGDEARARPAIERAYALDPSDDRTAALRTLLLAPSDHPR